MNINKTRLRHLLQNIRELRILPTISRRCKELPEGTFFCPFQVFGFDHVMIEHHKRKIVLVNMGGVRMPFYLSTGKGKRTVAPTAGRWFPFWGLDPDGWFNKGSNQAILDYYGSEVLRQVAEALDRKWGDIRGKKIGVLVGDWRNDPEQWTSVREQINVDVKGSLLKAGDNYIDYSEFKLSTPEAFYDRVRRVLDRINKGLSSVG